MSLEDAYDLPDDFVLARADDMERVEAADGTQLRVLVSHSTGERQLVHEDVVEFDGVLEHPAVSGLLGILGLAAVLLAPIVAGHYAVNYALVEAGEFDWVYNFGVLGGMAGLWGANYALWNTRIGTHIDRFTEWNDVKHIVTARGEAA